MKKKIAQIIANYWWIKVMIPIVDHVSVVDHFNDKVVIL